MIIRKIAGHKRKHIIEKYSAYCQSPEEKLFQLDLELFFAFNFKSFCGIDTQDKGYNIDVDDYQKG